MEKYRDLAVRYVKYDKRRSILTSVGVAVAVMVLYILLNLAWSYLLNYRNEIRKDRDYEIVLFTETREQIDVIIADDKVKDATVGRYYINDFNNPRDYANATFINVQNPYRMKKTLEYLSSKYGVEGELNNVLAETYMQGSTADVMYIGILVVVLVSYIFAILGVGIIRNSIQLTMLERIKDFGNLRCIGSTKRQLKGIIYIQGAIIEGIGIVIGVLFGWLGSIIAGSILHMNYVSFHILPVVCVVIAFAFDLYFAMDENAKLVTKMTPVSAIRGEYRIKVDKRSLRNRKNDFDASKGIIKEKIAKKPIGKLTHKTKKYKKQSSGIWGRIFGVEGDYAYKNLKRNKGRFRRTVAAMSIGIAAAMLIFGITRSMLQIVRDLNLLSGYYHISNYGFFNPYDSKEEVMKGIPPQDMLAAISSLPGVEKAAQLRMNGALVTDFEEYYSHWTDDYIEENGWLKGYKENEEQLLKDEEWDTANAGMYAMNVYNIPCYGYDSEDMQRYKQYLTEGTIDVSDHGIVLVESGYRYKYSEVSDRNYIDNGDYVDYKVGDTIEFIDMKEFRDRYNERLLPITEKYEQRNKALSDGLNSFKTMEADGEQLSDEQREEKGALEEQQRENDMGYIRDKDKLLYDVYKEVVEEGYTVTYTVEGTVNVDANYSSYGSPAIVLPTEQFYKITGTDDSWIYGMMYHFDRFPVSAYEAICMEYDPDYEYMSSSYAEFMSLLNQFRNGIIVVALIILFVVLMNVFNIINTTASDLFLRRKEFAQLRVIGLSKKDLFKMIMLEGVIQAVVSSFWGILIGSAIGILVFEMIFGLLLSYHYVFPVVAAFISVLVTVLLLCGAVYFPLKRLPNDVAAELATSGE